MVSMRRIELHELEEGSVLPVRGLVLSLCVRYILLGNVFSKERISLLYCAKGKKRPIFFPPRAARKKRDTTPL